MTKDLWLWACIGLGLIGLSADKYYQFGIIFRVTP